MTERTIVAGFVAPGTFHALRRFHPMLAKSFKNGDRVIVEIYEPRSVSWERKFFAIVNSAWMNLPWDMQQEFATPDELRKWALIQTGHCHERKGVMASNKAVLEYMSSPRATDDYVLFSVNGATFVERRPMSMRRDQMNREQFNKAADDVIACLAKLLGVSEKDLLASHDGAMSSAPASAASGDGPPSPGSKPAALDPSGAAGRPDPNEIAIEDDTRDQ